MRYSHSYSYVRNLCTGFRSRSHTELNTCNPQSSSTPLHLSEVLDDSPLSSLKLQRHSDSGDSSDVAFKRISSIFHAGQSGKKPNSEEIGGANEFDMSWLPKMPSRVSPQHAHSRERKQKFEFRIAQENRFHWLYEFSAKKLGIEATLDLFGKVGQKLGMKEYNASVEICVDKARGADDEDIALEEMGKVFCLFKSMREQGLELKEQTYRPLLLYIIDMCMVEEFQFFCHVIKDENPSSGTRLGYYEMMLWLRVNNEEKIQGLCNYITENDGEDTSDLRENYLLALCESERKEKILEVLEFVDIKKLSSAESIEKIFQALGRLLLEPAAEKFLLDFKTRNHEADKITNFIASYAVSIPNLLVEDVIKKFNDLHQELEVSPSPPSYEKLVLHSCALLKNYEELKQSEFKATKQIFMELINTYAACGQLEKAKQVTLDPLIPVKSLNQIKSVLVSVLASHGQLSEALLFYEEIKQAGLGLEPKDVMSLIEHTRSDGELDRLLLLLEELNNTSYWIYACCRIILYCIWNKHLSSAVDLCKLLKDKLQDNELVMKVLFDKVISSIEESESNHLHSCIELISEIKDKLGLLPSQKCYDSLLAALANANNSHNAE